jgi:hypothetical protein
MRTSATSSRSGSSTPSPCMASTRGGRARRLPGLDHRAVFMSTSQAYRDSDEMESALAYQIPTWCYSRIANPSTYYYEWTLALLEGYGFDGETACLLDVVRHGRDHDRGSALPRASEEHVHEERNFLATAQCYGGTFQQFNVRSWRSAESSAAGSRIRRTSTSGRAEDRRQHPLPLRRTAQQPRPRLLRHRGRRRSRPQPRPAAHLRRHGGTPALLRPICHGADIVVQSATKTLTTSGFGVCGPSSPQGHHDEHRQRADEGRLRPVHQVPAQPRLRAQPAPDAGDHHAERHAHAALQGRPHEPQHA